MVLSFLWIMELVKWIIYLLSFFSTETTLSKVQRSSLLLAYDINAVGPILVIKVRYFSFCHAVGENNYFCVISFAAATISEQSRFWMLNHEYLVPDVWSTN